MREGGPLDSAASNRLMAFTFFRSLFSLRVLSCLAWRRWFLGILGPRCTTAEDMLGALTYLFHLSAAAAQEPGLVEGALGSDWAAFDTTFEIRQRVRGAQRAGTDFDSLFPDAIQMVCAEANLGASFVREGLMSDAGRRTLLGTKVPEGAAFRLTAQVVEQGLEFGELYPDLARQAAANDELAVAALAECAGMDQEWHAGSAYAQGLALGKIWIRSAPPAGA